MNNYDVFMDFTKLYSKIRIKKTIMNNLYFNEYQYLLKLHNLTCKNV